jgi:hypothetical protein
VSASQFVIENIVTVLGGAGVLVTSLSTYLGKRWADSSLLKEKAKFAAEIKVLENNHSMAIKLLEKSLQLELAKKDQFHQISKSTYENLFNTKIAVYSQLLKLKTDYDRFQNESGSFEHIDPTEQILSHFKLFKEKIEDNRLYISNELSDKYNVWNVDAGPFFQRLEAAEMEVYAYGGFESDKNSLAAAIWDVQEPIIKELVAETFVKMTAVIQQIEKDVKNIKNNMSLIDA